MNITYDVFSLTINCIEINNMQKSLEIVIAIIELEFISLLLIDCHID